MLFCVGKTNEKKLVFKERLKEEIEEDKRVLVGGSFQSFKAIIEKFL